MKIKKIKNYQIFSCFFVTILGTILHFTYQLSGKNHIVAVFSSINESVWEHLKLLYFPMLLTIIIGFFYIGKSIPNFLCAKTLGIVTALLFTIIFFYTYTGILGKNIAFVDISSFFIATFIGEALSYILMINRFKCNNTVSIIILIVLFFLFKRFTFTTPNIALFKDPITSNYGIK